MVAGVHFLPDDPPGQIAQKLLRVNLSDLAAMGAAPLGYLLALARPKEISDGWLGEFCAGLAADNAAFGIALLGGDTVSTPGPLTLSLTAIGEVPQGAALLRSGAKAGDDVWVSGTLGDAALGLKVLQAKLAVAEPARAFLIERYRLPQPRLAARPSAARHRERRDRRLRRSGRRPRARPGGLRGRRRAAGGRPAALGRRP